MSVMIKYWIGIVTLLVISNNLIYSGIPDLPHNMVYNPETSILITKNQAQSGLYDLDSLKTIYLEFSQANWWQLLTQNYQSKKDIPADLIYGGTRYKDVGVRFRGQTSYQKIQNSKKKSFNISMDYLDSNQKIEVYKTLNLNNCFEDPSFMREALYMALAGEHIPTAKCNFVKLVINGENWGVYSNVQQLNRDFFNEWYLDTDGSIWRAEYPDTSSARPGPGGGQPGFGEGFCSLNYLDSNYLTYTKYYTLKASKKENPWIDLMNTCYKLNTLPIKYLYDSLQYFLDVDRSLWQIASEIIFTDDDGYVNKGGMDYYVYWDSEVGRIQPIEYDGNSTFNSKNTSWSPFVRENNIKYPLVNRLFQNPELKQRYVSHFRTMLDSIFIPEKVDLLIGKFKKLIETEVENDPKKLYTFSQFNTSTTELKSFVASRRNDLLGNLLIKQSAPEISDVNYFSDNGLKIPPKIGEKCRIQAKVSSTEGISRVRLYWGTGLTGTFDLINMSDNGESGDEIQDDGIYSAYIPGLDAGSYVRYYIEAISNNFYKTVTYNPPGAEHNVYLYQVRQEISAGSDLVINEIMAANTKTIADPQGEYDDWIELYNKGSKTISLAGMYLSDKSDNLKKWQFPDNTLMKAGEYLIIWADENGKATPGIHTNFKLSASGEGVYLTSSDETGNLLIDSVSFGLQNDDISFGRYPNGSGEFRTIQPTPGTENLDAVDVHNYAQVDKYPNINIFPNPFSDLVNISIRDLCEGGASISIFDKLGNMVKAYEYDGLQGSGIDVIWDGRDFNSQELPSGAYHLIIRAGNRLINQSIVLIR